MLPSLSLLQYLFITDCPELNSFPAGGLPTPNLIFLQVVRCAKVNSLPEPINTFALLEQLIIIDLPNLESFAKEGLPIELKVFYVRGTGNLGTTTIREWGWHRITSLQMLVIGGDEILNVLMKMKMPLLPTSLVILSIVDLSCIRCLDGKWLQHLTSLKTLDISNASRLESLPKEGFPSSLLELTINKCPLLEASCSVGGKEWLKISRIPCIIINVQVIN